MSQIRKDYPRAGQIILYYQGKIIAKRWYGRRAHRNRILMDWRANHQIGPDHIIGIIPDLDYIEDLELIKRLRF